MRRARLIPLLLFASGLPVVLGAQWTVTGDGGVSHIRQPGVVESNAFTLGATVERSDARTYFRSSALVANAGQDLSTLQAIAVGSVASPAWRSWSLQLTGTASVFGQTNLAPTSSGDAIAQLRGGNDLRGVALGGGIGATAHNGVWIAESRAIGDAWLARGAERFGVEASVTRTPSVFGESSILVDVSTREVNYLDLAGQWRHERGGWSFSVTSGVRGRNGMSRAAGWGAVEAVAWATPQLAIVAGAGRTLEDLVRGVPRASYATLGIRISSLAHARAFGRRVSAGPRIVITRVDGARRVDIDAKGATRVELMADFTGWSAVTLDRSGETWTVERQIAPGPHRVAIRIDGGDWIVPTNLPRVEDDLGGAVGLITVP